MIQVYKKSNSSYSMNGDSVIFPTSCEIKAELNGTWVLEMQMPFSQGWEYVTEDAVLKVPTWQQDEQLYRIARVTKRDEGLSVTAYPIFYDSAKDCFLLDVRPTSKTGQGALDMMCKSPYSGSSDIGTLETAYFVRRNLLSAINGSESPTFVERWGGEIEYDNYTVVVNQRIGGDYGAEARYGLNMQGIEYTVDTSELITRIVPVGFNGRMLSYSNPWVDSSKIGLYPTVYTKEVRYEHIRLASDGATDDPDDIVCQDQAALNQALVAAAQADFAAGVDNPKITMDIDMFAIPEQRMHVRENILDTGNDDILDTEDDEIYVMVYKSFKTLTDIRLGDTVTCRHYKLDISAQARVIALSWDCILKRVTRITLGDYADNYVKDVYNTMNRVQSAITPNGELVAEKVKGYLDGAQVMLKAQYDIAQHQDVLAILFEDLDTTSPMYGALGIGTQGLCISKTRTQDGKSWVWTTGMTANGLNAGVGLFGTLAVMSGQTEALYVDAETGTVRINADSLTLKTGENLADAGKTATNYLSWTSQGGLVVSKDASVSTGYNVQITGSAINMRNGTTVLAELKNTALNFYKPGTTNVAASFNSNGIDIKDGKIGQYITLDSENGRIVFENAVQSFESYIDHEGNAVFYELGIENGFTLGAPNSAADFYIHGNGRFDGNVWGSMTVGTQGAASPDTINVYSYLYAHYRFRAYDTVHFTGISEYSSATPIGVDSAGSVRKISSSSLRYKDIDRQLTPSDVEKLFSLPVYKAKYKDGYLAKDDPMVGKYLPMLVAEDVAEILPEAVIRDAKGQVEDWNYRTLIPVMIEMIKSLKEEVKRRGEIR